MFRRRSDESTDAAASEGAVVTEAPASGKGRPTPTRREAEAARKARAAVPKDRKAAAKVLREKRAAERKKVRAALETGDERYLPARDRGPVKRFVRDFVDGRFNVAEFLLPILLVILVLSLFPAASQIVVFAWMLMILATVSDTILLVFMLKRAIKRAHPDTTERTTFYAIMRSMQMRRMRLPKPQVPRGHRPA